MGFGFHELIAHAAYSRNLSAGTIVGSGTVSNANYRVVGSGCIAERRAIELADRGRIETEYMRFGDRVRIEMLDAQGHSVFGAIHQQSCRRIRHRRANDSALERAQHPRQTPSNAARPGGTLSDIRQIKHWRAPVTLSATYEKLLAAIGRASWARSCATL